MFELAVVPVVHPIVVGLVATVAVVAPAVVAAAEGAMTTN